MTMRHDSAATGQHNLSQRHETASRPQHPGAQESPTIMSSSHWAMVRTALRSVVLIVVGWLLIMVLFPAALVAAGN